MGISNVGNHDFAPVGSVRWIPNGWDFDRLVEPWQGSAENLAAFIAALVPWQASATDGNMYLDDWSSNGDPVFPIVDLNFMGKKGGSLPPTKHLRGSQIGTIAGAGNLNGLVIEFTITYAPASATQTWISTHEETRPTVGMTLPGALGPTFGISLLTRGGLASTIPDTFFFNALHVQQAVADFQSEEVVPAKYWRNSLTTTWSLIE